MLRVVNLRLFLLQADAAEAQAEAAEAKAAELEQLVEVVRQVFHNISG
jgi:hypothetical protein